MRRRTFLQSAALAGISRAWSAPTGMFVSLNGTLTGSMPWPEFARLAARTGYPGVDVNLSAAMKEGAEATKAMLAELKIKPGIIGLPVPFSRDEAAYEAALPRLADAAKFAAAIGCPRMTTVLPASSDTPKAELRKTFQRRLSAISEILARSGVRLGLEFLGPMHIRTSRPHEFIWRMDETVEFAAQCGPNIGLLLDAWHWHHAGAKPADIIAAGKSKIVHVHVSDAKKQPPEEVRDNQRLLAGEGVIDLRGFFRALQKIGYVDAVSPEPLGRIPKDTAPEAGARMGLESTVAVLRKAGVAA